MDRKMWRKCSHIRNRYMVYLAVVSNMSLPFLFFECSVLGFLVTVLNIRKFNSIVKYSVLKLLNRE